MKLISIDAETNGLWGDVFAVGAVALDGAGRELGRFAGQYTELRRPVDGFVAQHVLPALRDVTVFPGDSLLFKEFWRWLRQHSVLEELGPGGRSPLVVVDCGFPVEARLFEELAAWDEHKPFMPYPLHEAASVLLAAGVDPDVNREAYARPLLARQPMGRSQGRRHDPAHDALVSGMCVLRALAALRDRGVAAHAWVTVAA